LDDTSVGDRVRALAKLRCENLEDRNKYWMPEKRRSCLFCDAGWDDLEHYVDECKIVRDWFIGLGKNKKEKIENIWSDKISEEKGRIIVRMWKEREVKRKTRSDVIDSHTSQ